MASAAASTPIPPEYEVIAEMGKLEDWVSEAAAAAKVGEDGMYAGLEPSKHLSFTTNMFAVIGTRLDRLWTWAKGAQTKFQGHEDKLGEHEAKIGSVAGEMTKMKDDVTRWGRGMDDRMRRIEEHVIEGKGKSTKGSWGVLESKAVQGLEKFDGES